MATTELLKSNENCSNIFFIDENACVGDTLNLINNNVSILSANLVDLSRDFPMWAGIFSSFVAASGTLITTLLNIENIENTIGPAYSCVQTFSGNWVKEFSLYFPTMFNIADWEVVANKDLTLKAWLNANFPADFFPDYQIVNIFVSTNQQLPFEFTFSRSYEENCAPRGGSTTVTCNGCGSGNQGIYRSAGCNVKGGPNKGYCGNAFKLCGNPSTITQDSRSFTCIANSGQRLTGGAGGPLQIGLYDIPGQGFTPARFSPVRSVDTCFARVYSYKYIKTFNDIDGATWNIIT
jgi:hypothetical protein